jgi:AcrR family transcriptional regulator
VRSGSASRPSNRSGATRATLVEATIDVLGHEGFAAATSRGISARAGCPQGLIFYHFGSVVNLLLAALDEVSARRRRRYDEALAGVSSPSQLVDLAVRVFAEDLDSGDASVLVEMVAGAASTPGLAAEVKARMMPWADFARSALEQVLGGSPIGQMVGLDEASHAVVALYLGLELLSHLDGDRAPALALFERGRGLALLLEAMGAPSGPQQPQRQQEVPT